MKERPILFSAPMVRALLAGTKTQTRRVVKPPRGRDSFVVLGSEDSDALDWWPYESDDGESEICDDGCEHPYESPFGTPGDRLWVRETHAAFIPCGDGVPYYRTGRTMVEPIGPHHSARREVVYRADGEDVKKPHPRAATARRWTPAIHMPRWASRIDLEVTGVRVERLQDISEADALAEGLQLMVRPAEWGGNTVYSYEGFGEWVPTGKTAYRALWESINGASSWAANPFVWVIEFRRVIKP